LISQFILSFPSHSARICKEKAKETPQLSFFLRILALSEVKSNVNTTLENKVALVTGGTSGIGKAAALALAAAAAKPTHKQINKKKGNLK
jgi:hypothetical protein